MWWESCKTIRWQSYSSHISLINHWNSCCHRHVSTWQASHWDNRLADKGIDGTTVERYHSHSPSLSSFYSSDWWNSTFLRKWGSGLLTAPPKDRAGSFQTHRLIVVSHAHTPTHSHTLPGPLDVSKDTDRRHTHDPRCRRWTSGLSSPNIWSSLLLSHSAP